MFTLIGFIQLSEFKSFFFLKNVKNILYVNNPSLIYLKDCRISKLLLDISDVFSKAAAQYETILTKQVPLGTIFGIKTIKNFS